jgi:hypothetical protein
MVGHEVAPSTYSSIKDRIMKQKNIYTPYTYFIGWSKESKFYYGSRYATKHKCLYESGCHPDDFWVTYFTSSTHVKEMIEKFGAPDVMEVRKTFTDAKSAKRYETRFLKKVGAVQSESWLNKSNGHDFIVSKEKYKEMGERRKGVNHPPRSKEFREAISKANKGRVFSKEVRLKMKRGKVKPYTVSYKDQVWTFEYIQEMIDTLGISRTTAAYLKKNKVFTFIRKPNNSTRWRKGDTLIFEWL